MKSTDEIIQGFCEELASDFLNQVICDSYNDLQVEFNQLKMQLMAATTPELARLALKAFFDNKKVHEVFAHDIVMDAVLHRILSKDLAIDWSDHFKEQLTKHA